MLSSCTRKSALSVYLKIHQCLICLKKGSRPRGRGGALLWFENSRPAGGKRSTSGDQPFPTLSPTSSSTFSPMSSSTLKPTSSSSAVSPLNQQSHPPAPPHKTSRWRRRTCCTPLSSQRKPCSGTASGRGRSKSLICQTIFKSVRFSFSPKTCAIFGDDTGIMIPFASLE